MLLTIDRRCKKCNALLFKVKGITVIRATSNFSIRFQAFGEVETTCKCGTVDTFVPKAAKKSVLPTAAAY